MRLSVVIPARHEIYLKQTVDDLLSKAAGDIEVIVVLDGYWPHEYPKDDPRLTFVHRDRRGMRDGINSAIAIAKGEYVMKVDAHCMFAEGFDEVLKAECDKDWIVIPRRYSLDIDTWSIRQYRPFVDYEYLGWPYRQKNTVHGSKTGIHAWVWDERIAERSNKLLDENMTFQGSCWFTPREYFLNHIGPMQNEGYGTFIGEAQEIGLKAWLGGGKVMTNKKTWYAHLWKGEPYRQAHQKILGIPYTRIGHAECVDGNNFSIDYWTHNRWSGRKHDLSWLVERFWPVPSWPEEREQWTR
jgi:glycosyltransferase involved in cell wall biosynthesis